MDGPVFSNINVDSHFLDEEDIIAKLNFIENMERRWPYPPSRDQPFFNRIKRSILMLPSQFHKYALALFANVIYLPESLLKQSLNYLHLELRLSHGMNNDDIENESMFFEVDPCGLVRTFFHESEIHGRLDIDKIPRFSCIDDLIRSLVILASDICDDNHKEDIKKVIKKKYWIFLSDNVLSGTSYLSDLIRASQIIKDFSGQIKPIIIPLCQILTDTAEEKLLDERWKRPTGAIKFDSRFRINLDTIDDCKLFNKKSTVDGVIQLCQWFAEQTFFKDDESYKRTKELSGCDLSFGFKKCGLTIVTPNCPTNSIPILWHDCAEYSGPFPRIKSRVTQSKSKADENIGTAIKFRDKILKKLQS